MWRKTPAACARPTSYLRTLAHPKRHLSRWYNHSETTGARDEPPHLPFSSRRLAFFHHPLVFQNERDPLVTVIIHSFGELSKEPRPLTTSVAAYTPSQTTGTPTTNNKRCAKKEPRKRCYCASPLLDQSITGGAGAAYLSCSTAGEAARYIHATTHTRSRSCRYSPAPPTRRGQWLLVCY